MAKQLELTLYTDNILTLDGKDIFLSIEGVTFTEAKANDGELVSHYGGHNPAQWLGKDAR